MTNKFKRKNNTCFGRAKKHCRKRRKCGLLVFTPFPTMFSNALSFKVVKSQNCVVELMENKKIMKIKKRDQIKHSRNRRKC